MSGLEKTTFFGCRKVVYSFNAKKKQKKTDFFY